MNLIHRFDLKVFDVQLVPIHGQSLRVCVRKNFDVLTSVDRFLKKEKALGLDKKETFLKFSEKIRKNKGKVRNLLLQLKKEGKRIIGYGAPAKGNTLLNYFQIGNSILDFLTDTTPLKQGLYSPGTHIPIYSPAIKILEKEALDYILLLAWNYADAIMEKEKIIRERGVKFIIPVPEVKII